MPFANALMPLRPESLAERAAAVAAVSHSSIFRRVMKSRTSVTPIAWTIS